MNLGGDVFRNNALKNIVSVGYEIECGVLAKMTLSEMSESTNKLLLNTDTTSKDVSQLKKLENDLNALDDNVMKRIEETVEMESFDKHGKIDKNTEFHITNDYAVTPFLKKLKPLCFYNDDDDENNTHEKNLMYKFHAKSGDIYDINFILNAFNNCESFSCVEWIFTYYKPERSTNVVLETFVNMMTNLIHHIDDLKPIHGNLKLHYFNDEEQIIDKPNDRILYHKPNTNIYYLQTHVLDKPLTLDDVCSKIQMTFGAKAEHIFDIMLALLDSNKYEKVNEQYKAINNVKICVEELVEKSGHDVNARAKAYIGLILFKLRQYYIYQSLDKKDSSYFKNALFMNARHSNYDLYLAFKKCVKTNALNTLCDIVLQPDILNKYLENPSVRRGAFSKNNILNQDAVQYGNPAYSLHSYFQFFETPRNDESNLDYKGKILYNDWLQYKKIDFSSAKLPLKRDVVLVESRSFHNIITSFIQSIADDELTKNLTGGICNEITKKHGVVSAYSIRDMRKIVELCKPLLSNKLGTRIATAPKSITINNIISRNRCKNGTHKNRTTGQCETIKPVAKRCANGTRKNRKSGQCEVKN